MGLESITINLSELNGLEGHSFAEVLDTVGEGSATLEGDTLTIEGFTTVILK